MTIRLTLEFLEKSVRQSKSLAFPGISRISATGPVLCKITENSSIIKAARRRGLQGIYRAVFLVVYQLFYKKLKGQRISVFGFDFFCYNRENTSTWATYESPRPRISTTRPQRQALQHAQANQRAI